MEHSLKICDFNSFGIIQCHFCSAKYYRKDGGDHECLGRYKREYFRQIVAQKMLTVVEEKSKTVR